MIDSGRLRLSDHLPGRALIVGWYALPWFVPSVLVVPTVVYLLIIARDVSVFAFAIVGVPLSCAALAVGVKGAIRVAQDFAFLGDELRPRPTVVVAGRAMVLSVLPLLCVCSFNLAGIARLAGAPSQVVLPALAACGVAMVVMVVAGPALLGQAASAMPHGDSMIVGGLRLVAAHPLRALRCMCASVALVAVALLWGPLAVGVTLPFVVALVTLVQFSSALEASANATPHIHRKVPIEPH